MVFQFTMICLIPLLYVLILSLSSCDLLIIKKCDLSEECVNVFSCRSFDHLRRQKTNDRAGKLWAKKNICGFADRSTPKVCCPEADKTQLIVTTTEKVEADGNTVRTTTRKPRVNLKSRPENHTNFRLLPINICGPVLSDFEKRITTGIVAAPGEFPWMALIAYDDSEDEFRCAGSLISEHYILTAAHCIDDTILGVRLGEHDIRTETDCDENGQNCQPPVQDLLIDKVTQHPDYDPTTFLNDIALIRLVDAVNFTEDHIKPICLPFGDSYRADLTHKFLKVAGWGVTETGDKSAILRHVSIPVNSTRECRTLFQSLKPITRKQICAGGYKGRDSCAGDSGGPLKRIYRKNGGLRYVQHGVVSYGPKHCGIDGRPGVYTNVAEYMGWILDNIEPR